MLPNISSFGFLDLEYILSFLHSESSEDGSQSSEEPQRQQRQRKKSVEPDEKPEEKKEKDESSAIGWFSIIIIFTIIPLTLLV